MATYWLTFRLADDATYHERYKRLNETVDELCIQWWFDTSSFYVFESASDIDQVAAKVKAVINPAKDKDIVLIGMPNFKSARLIGVPDHESIFTLMPFAKKA